MVNKIFARYDDNSIRVYQAFNHVIADEAIKKGTFGESFSMNRMTWIKPSFLWMMYRSGWASKDGQNRILAIDMKRSGFDDIVRNAVLSSYSGDVYKTREIWRDALKKSAVRCQWDPERDIHGNPQPERTIQLGIKGGAAERYVKEWILNITDITLVAAEIKTAIRENRFADSMLPVELEYHI